MEKLMSVAVVFPGQGAQFVGMGKDFYDKFSNIRDFYSNADRALGYSLSDIMFNGPENDLKLTPTVTALISFTCIIYCPNNPKNSSLHRPTSNSDFIYIG